MGASKHTINVTAVFLTQRRMQFKVGEARSSERQLRGGAPKGTLLGNFLFILSTNRLEDPSGTAMTSTLSSTSVIGGSEGAEDLTVVSEDRDENERIRKCGPSGQERRTVRTRLNMSDTAKLLITE